MKPKKSLKKPTKPRSGAGRVESGSADTVHEVDCVGSGGGAGVAGPEANCEESGGDGTLRETGHVESGCDTTVQESTRMGSGSGKTVQEAGHVESVSGNVEAR